MKTNHMMKSARSQWSTSDGRGQVSWHKLKHVRRYESSSQGLVTRRILDLCSSTHSDLFVSTIFKVFRRGPGDI